MTSSAPFAGKNRRLHTIFFSLVLVLSLRAQALHKNFEEGNYLQPALIYTGAVTTFYFISQFQDGTLVFTGLYGISALYLMREVYTEMSFENYDSLAVPVSLMTMALLNAAVFSDDDEFSDHEVFLYNVIGATAIAVYATWDHSQRKPRRHYSHAARTWTVAPALVAGRSRSPGGIAWIGQYSF